MTAALHSRYGLSFGATTVVASRFNSTGIVELTLFPASSEYRSLYTQAVHYFQASDNEINEADMKSALEVNVDSIIEGLTKQVGQEPEIAALFLPSVFDWKMRSAATDAIFSDAQHATVVGSTRRAACYGFEFLQGKNLGRPISECNDSGPKSLVLLLEYEKEYLYAWVVEVEFELGVYSPEQDRICKECGERCREAIGRQDYEERVDKFLRDFVELEVLAKNRREDIRAIIVLGEASVAGAKELGHAALAAVGTADVRLMTIFEPSEVVAHGASVVARLTQEHPEHFITRSTNRVLSDDEYSALVAERKEREEAEHNEL